MPLGLSTEALRSVWDVDGVERATCGREEVSRSAAGWAAAHIGPRRPDNTGPGGPQLGALPPRGRRPQDLKWERTI
ncbi:hypothetical protein NDU88_002783 [Pleurodeles waltl]|uniref:Uncharacterized protein n=1 Tax=Pleurodeles waltl TaxID=8319 RepID=A0AAV7SDW8_PLEWA|nr:hypothetical protein NDU88_002783 [Pleurodeles waltl]